MRKSETVHAQVVAAWLRIPIETLQEWAATGQGPAPITGDDGQLRYDVAQLEDWLNA